MILGVHRWLGRALRTIPVVLISLALASCGDSTGPKHLLQQKIFPNDSFIIYLSADLDVSVMHEETPYAMGGESDLYYRVVVTSIDPTGNIDLDVKIQSAVYPGFVAPLGPAISSKSFSMRMSPAGEVIDIDGGSELKKIAAIGLVPVGYEKLTQGKSEAEKKDFLDRYKESVLSNLDDVALRATIEPFFRFWPTTPVAVGDSWLQQGVLIYTKFVGRIFGDLEYTVASWDAAEVALSVSGTIYTLEDDLDRKFAGEITGSIIIDPIVGFIRSATFVNTYEGDMIAGSVEERSALTAREEVYFELLRL